MATFYASASLPQLEAAPAAATRKLLHSAVTRPLTQITAPAEAVTQCLTGTLKARYTKAQVVLPLLVLLVVGLAWFSPKTKMFNWWQARLAAPPVKVQALEPAVFAHALQTVEAAPAPVAPAAAWQVLAEETRHTSEAQNAAAADQRMATILPGGQLALTFQAGEFFSDGPQTDLRILGAAQAASYRVFVRHDTTATWRRIDINRRGFANGCAAHDMGHHGINQARQLLILNDAAKPLQIDAVNVIYQDKVFAEVEQPLKVRQHSPRKRQPLKKLLRRQHRQRLMRCR
jgi:hypothetical protein